LDNVSTSVLGIRCWKDRYSYVIATGTRTAFTTAVGHVPLPVNDERGAQLSKFRQDIIDLLTQHNVVTCFYRQLENNAQKVDARRAELEGVFQEACHSHEPSVRAVGKTLQQLKSACEFDGKSTAVLTLFKLPQFAKLQKGYFEEAAVVAFAALRP